MKHAMLILLSVLVFSCNTNTQKQNENASIVEQYVKAVEALDYKKMEGLLSDNYQGFGPSAHHSIDKQTALEKWKENAENLYHKIEYIRSEYSAVSIKDGENKGDWVTNWAELIIEYKDGRGPVKIWANSNYKIENGKIVKTYTIYNEADVLRQLGYVFIHPDDL